MYVGYAKIYRDWIFPEDEDYEDYEDYMSNQPMRDGEEIRSFFDDEEEKTESEE